MSSIVQSNELEFAQCYPLHQASRIGDSQKVLLLLETNRNLAITEDRFYGWTAAHWAAYAGKLDCLRNILCSYASNLNLQSSKTGSTLAHCASETGQAHCLLWLLQAGTNPNLKDFCGETPLHKAARNGNAECVSLLIESSCDVRIFNNSGELASMLAEKYNHPSLGVCIHQAELVRELGAPDSSFNDISNFNMNEERFNRKRRFGAMNENFAKRVRTGEPDVAIQSMDLVENADFRNLDNTTNVVEHRKPCAVEQGYVCKMFHMMFSDYHGC